MRILDENNIENFLEDIEYEKGYDYILTDGKYYEESIQLMEKNSQATSIIDAGRVNEGVLRLCNKVDYIICSEDFATALTGCKITDDYNNNMMVYYTLKGMFKNAKGITITIGSRGYICEKDGQVFINPAYKSGLPVVDTNCAGDIYHGAFVYGLANDFNYEKIIKYIESSKYDGE